MKRPRQEQPWCKHNKKKQQQYINHFLSLPEDMLKIIISFATNNSTAKTLKIAAQTVNTLAKTDKRFNMLINNPQFSDKLIDDLRQIYHCSHEKVARFLHTKAANKRWELQYQLKTFNNLQYPSNQIKKLHDLVRRGVDLNFIFNFPTRTKTILMAVEETDNYKLFQALLALDQVNVNACNTYGCSTLHVAMESPIDQRMLDELLKHPRLIIDQPTTYGTTPLLHGLNNRKRRPISPTFSYAVDKLLALGADPEYANNNAITPLQAAKALVKNYQDKSIEQTIQQAIIRKHTPQN